jgi:hypothetical protein
MEVYRPNIGGISTDGWFPTEYLEKQHVISLKPKEKYRVFWNKNPQEEEGSAQQPTGTKPGKFLAFSAVRRWF